MLCTCVEGRSMCSIFLRANQATISRFCQADVKYICRGQADVKYICRGQADVKYISESPGYDK